MRLIFVEKDVWGWKPIDWEFLWFINKRTLALNYLTTIFFYLKLSALCALITYKLLLVHQIVHPTFFCIQRFIMLGWVRLNLYLLVKVWVNSSFKLMLNLKRLVGAHWGHKSRCKSLKACFRSFDLVEPILERSLRRSGHRWDLPNYYKIEYTYLCLYLFTIFELFICLIKSVFQKKI